MAPEWPSFLPLFLSSVCQSVNLVVKSAKMDLLCSVAWGAVLGLAIFGTLVASWAMRLLLDILEALKTIESFLKPQFDQRLGLDYQEDALCTLRFLRRAALLVPWHAPAQVSRWRDAVHRFAEKTARLRK